MIDSSSTDLNQIQPLDRVRRGSATSLASHQQYEASTIATMTPTGKDHSHIKTELNSFLSVPLCITKYSRGFRKLLRVQWSLISVCDYSVGQPKCMDQKCTDSKGESMSKAKYIPFLSTFWANYNRNPKFSWFLEVVKWSSNEKKDGKHLGCDPISLVESVHYLSNNFGWLTIHPAFRGTCFMHSRKE